MTLRRIIAFLLLFSFFIMSSEAILFIPAYAQESAEEHLKRGIESYEDAFFEKAVDELNTALKIGLKKEKDRLSAYKYLSFSYIALTKEDKAKDAFRKLLKLNPSFQLDKDTSPRIVKLFTSINVEDRLKKGIKYYEDAFFEKAVEELNTALEFLIKYEMDTTSAYKYLGFSWTALGQEDKAKDAFGEMLKSNPAFELDKDISPRIARVFNEIRVAVVPKKKKKKKMTWLYILLAAGGGIAAAASGGGGGAEPPPPGTGSVGGTITLED